MDIFYDFKAKVGVLQFTEHYVIIYNMDIKERKKEILIILAEETTPISASVLAKKFNVSRQVVVGDVALLRAEGHYIIATPRGYVLKSPETEFSYVGTVPCDHDLTRLEKELYIIVDNGGTVIDVTVEHSIYGQIVGQLNIASRDEVDLFIKSVNDSSNQPLSVISGGVHLHRIGCKNAETFKLIYDKLREEKIICS